MGKKYQKPNHKTNKQPLLEYSMPLTEAEWRHLLEWVEKNHSSRVNQPLKEVTI